MQDEPLLPGQMKLKAVHKTVHRRTRTCVRASTGRSLCEWMSDWHGSNWTYVRASVLGFVTSRLMMVFYGGPTAARRKLRASNSDPRASTCCTVRSGEEKQTINLVPLLDGSKSQHCQIADPGHAPRVSWAELNRSWMGLHGSAPTW